VRRISYWVISTFSALVILFSYHTSTNSMAAASPTPPTPADTEGSTGTATPAATTNASDPAPSTDSTTTTTTSGSYTGSQVSTRWGIVQVRITVTNGKITSAQAIEYPNDNYRDQQINAYALPILNSEVVTAQSANIDSVSGATVTSNGYTSSLQSAIDQAHL
jgi:uncharacterized protein with FMN-binding domain